VPQGTGGGGGAACTWRCTFLRARYTRIAHWMEMAALFSRLCTQSLRLRHNARRASLPFPRPCLSVPAAGSKPTRTHCSARTDGVYRQRNEVWMRVDIVIRRSCCRLATVPSIVPALPRTAPPLPPPPGGAAPPHATRTDCEMSVDRGFRF
jgi:hypothetical protein